MHKLGTSWLFGLMGCLIFVGMGIPGCSGNDQDKAAGQTVMHTYTLRGRIVSLPDASNPASELKVHHEAIDDFKMGDGEPSPMSAMTMSFSAGEGETFEGIKVGDAVEFTFEMQWEPAAEMRAVGFKKLAADTVLSFEAEPGAMDHGDQTGHSH